MNLKISQVLKICKTGAEKLLIFFKRSVLNLCKKGAESTEFEFFTIAGNMEKRCSIKCFPNIRNVLKCVEIFYFSGFSTYFSIFSEINANLT